MTRRNYHETFHESMWVAVKKIAKHWYYCILRAPNRIFSLFHTVTPRSSSFS